MKDVFTITEKEGWEKGVWRKIGTAFQNKDGSLTILLDALPVNGKLHIRERRNKGDEKGEEK